MLVIIIVIFYLSSSIYILDARFPWHFEVFNSCDVLKPYVAHIDDIFKDFTSYKVRVPVTGAIILDETYERVSQE